MQQFWNWIMPVLVAAVGKAGWEIIKMWAELTQLKANFAAAEINHKEIDQASKSELSKIKEVLATQNTALAVIQANTQYIKETMASHSGNNLPRLTG